MMTSTQDAPAPAPSRPVGGRSTRPALAHVISEYAVLFVVGLVAIVLALINESFRSSNNLTNVLTQCAVVGVLACGVAVVFIAGEFDLSIGAIYSVAPLIAAAAVSSVGGIGGILAGIAAGAAMGLVNGLLVSAGRINAFMATLSTSFLLGGVGVLLTEGTPQFIHDETFLSLGRAAFLGLSFPVFVLAGVTLLLTVVLQATKFGRWVYATGGNKEAARLSGVNVTFVKSMAFVISGAAAGLAGTMASAQIGAADPNAGLSLVLFPIAAVVVGGISIYGGEGAVWRAVAGILLLVLINNGFNLLGINALFSQIVQGSVILIAVAIDAWTRKTRG
ncbi:ABC transporter permease [Streptomyces canus]|uniref:ABC transporter permease n=1 Tax=Streptomyces canus TaxID=58343 RepID=UPI0036C5CA52